MSLASFEADVREHVQAVIADVESAFTKGKDFLDSKLPEVADGLSKLAGSPVVKSLEAYAGITPGEENLVAELIDKLHNLRLGTDGTAPASGATETAQDSDPGTAGTPAPSDAAQDITGPSVAGVA